MHSEILRLKNVTVIYRIGTANVKALDNVSIEFRSGDSIGILGRSGSGKSTLAKVAVGLIKPSSGEILFRGRNIMKLKGRDAKEFRRSVQLIFQDPYDSLDPEAKVLDAILEGLKINKLAKPQIALEALLKTLGLEGLLDRKISQLSGGERQRVAIARTLTVGPKLVIFDEPTTMLDAMHRRNIIEIICLLRKNLGVSIAVITHNILDLACVDKIAIMKDGKIVAMGAKMELMRSSDEYVRSLIRGLASPKDFRL
jgi:ABC-type glutathione transport system ATPase component